MSARFLLPLALAAALLSGCSSMPEWTKPSTWIDGVSDAGKTAPPEEKTATATNAEVRAGRRDAVAAGFEPLHDEGNQPVRPLADDRGLDALSGQREGHEDALVPNPGDAVAQRSDALDPQFGALKSSRRHGAPRSGIRHCPPARRSGFG